ncbi:MAG TPA: NUDIX domain-containing protein [Mesorhizobium sp.]|jgi:ADP-ribose pyrophosphatase YjhB (NUDIX family)|nr:NUDIX domain-containing protein [Mesorhizobium sp.]
MTDNDDLDPVQTGWPKLRGKLFHLYFRLRRPMTLGVRGVVLDRAKDSVFLIRHTYVPGWQLPGGGVEAGETVREALAHELREEGNIMLDAPPLLLGLYFSRQVSRRDHVAVFVCERFRQTEPKQPDLEIAEAAFFPLDRLPDGVTPGTTRRIAEALGRREPGEDW